MVYQVYLNWTGDQYNGREILVFPNRHYADEFYNRCITTTATGTVNPLDDIVRYSPQFWTFPKATAESRPFYFIESNAQDLIPTIMAARISGYDNNHATGAMPIIPNDATSNVEHVSGGAYYIRTKSTPHLYWFLQNQDHGTITLDPRKATKFQINRDDSAKPSPAPANDRRVLERKDDIQLVALSQSGTHTIGVSGDNVSTAAASFRFAFGSFYNGDFGVNWSATSEQTGDPALAYKVQFAGQEWELVN
ncbi:unnamed protein product [Penicillium camemberti]|uniref:Str. FM013 n=1 Tax=Penicillium camemberti (strain FM 013) TaxID=1429867 RepID=A0A0G4PWD2_PENC3|nr:unnamed protein product [Penicillium camemberti]